MSREKWDRAQPWGTELERQKKKMDLKKNGKEKFDFGKKKELGVLVRARTYFSKAFGENLGG